MYNPEIAGRLDALRAELKKRGLKGFVVPLTDEHNSEYVADYAQRLAWLTGFLGSAGMAMVTADAAAVFVDGRYTIQIVDQVDDKIFERRHLIDEPPIEWLREQIKAGDQIGYDPFLHTIGWVKSCAGKLAGVGAGLVAVDGNPIDAVWHDQPGEPNAPVHAQPIRYSGQSSDDKRTNIAAALQENGADAVVLSALDSIAWLFNIRSDDVLHTPVSLAFATVGADSSAVLYIDPAKVTSELKAHLGNQVEVRAKADFIDGLKALGAQGKTVMADPASASSAIFDALKSSGASIVTGMDPCALPKSRKNKVEQQGSRDAHIRDGAAVSEFLHWLSVEAPKGELDELKAAAKLRAFRDKNSELKDLSFRTISAAGSNGALCHYSVCEETNLPIELDSIYLVDSGGQYGDGTTDITRTIAVGTPTPEQMDRFTRVLKGHIALATAIFPKGTTGPALDTLARRPLWEVGLDYDHGTGHGVGSFLAVHEGPGRIAKLPNSVALEPGMIFSDEPGYYKAGEYGIRIENLVIVQNADVGGEQEMLRFEVVTLAPIDRNLVDTSILTSEETDWFNAYHARVMDTLGPLVSPRTREWMIAATAPI
jgi:Xaa-Pro aminopeptidase